MKKRLMVLIAAVMFMTAFQSAPVYAQFDKAEEQNEVSMAKLEPAVNWEKAENAKEDNETEDVKVETMALTEFKNASGAAVNGVNGTGTVEEKDEQEKKDEKEKPAKKEKKSKKKNYTNADVKLLACLIYSEAGNQPYKGKLAVGNVVMDRVKSNLFPNTMKEVIYQKSYSRTYGRTIYQFSVAYPSVGTLKKALNLYGKRTNPIEIKMEKECIKAAKAALEGKRAFEGKNYLFFCRYNSGIASRKPNGTKLSAHYFYR